MEGVFCQLESLNNLFDFILPRFELFHFRGVGTLVCSIFYWHFISVWLNFLHMHLSSQWFLGTLASENSRYYPRLLNHGRGLNTLPCFARKKLKQMVVGDAHKYKWRVLGNPFFQLNRCISTPL
jgi:hypothetical protein